MTPQIEQKSFYAQRLTGLAVAMVSVSVGSIKVYKRIINKDMKTNETTLTPLSVALYLVAFFSCIGVMYMLQ